MKITSWPFHSEIRRNQTTDFSGIQDTERSWWGFSRMRNWWKYFGLATWQRFVQTRPTPPCQVPKIGRLQAEKNVIFQFWLWRVYRWYICLAMTEKQRSNLTPHSLKQPTPRKKDKIYDIWLSEIVVCRHFIKISERRTNKVSPIIALIYALGREFPGCRQGGETKQSPEASLRSGGGVQGGRGS